MTFLELLTETAKLGFLPDIRDNERFVGTANRALMQVGTLAPRRACLRVVHNLPQNLRTGAKSFCIDRPMTVTARGARTYSFFAAGEGTLSLFADENLVLMRTLTGTGWYEGGIYSDAIPISEQMQIRLQISPAGSMRVQDLALYAADLSDMRDVILRGDTWWYDLSYLAGCPVTEVLLDGARFTPRCDGVSRTLPQGVRVEGGRLGIPADAAGVYEVPVRTLPRPFDGTESQEADVSPELAVLLPLLCAAEIFYEEDPEKSAFYLSLYRMQSAGVRGGGDVVPTRVVSTCGW